MKCTCTPKWHEEWRRDLSGEYAIAVTLIHARTCGQWAAWQEDVGD